MRGPIRELCADHRVRINMAPGVDSLNIGVATGILLHWFADSDGRPGWLGEGEVIPAAPVITSQVAAFVLEFVTAQKNHSTGRCIPMSRWLAAPTGA